MEMVRGKFQLKGCLWHTMDLPPGQAWPKLALLSQPGEGQVAEKQLESWTALPVPASRVYQHEICSQVNRWASCLPTALSGGMRVKWKLSVDWHQFCDLTRMQHGHWLSLLHQGQPLAHCPSQQSPCRKGSCPGTGRDFRAVLRCGTHNAGHQQSTWERACAFCTVTLPGSHQNPSALVFTGTLASHKQ